jgi:hypothetical protein
LFHTAPSILSRISSVAPAVALRRRFRRVAAQAILNNLQRNVVVGGAAKRVPCQFHDYSLDKSNGLFDNRLVSKLSTSLSLVYRKIERLSVASECPALSKPAAFALELSEAAFYQAFRS